MHELIGNFIDGKWQPAKSGKTFENLSPADTSDVVGVFASSEAADVDALLFREAEGGARRRADGIVGDGLGRAGDFVHHVGLLARQVLRPHGQPPRTSEGLDRDSGSDALGGQQLFQVGLEIASSFGNHPGGDLFTPDLEEEFQSLFRLRLNGSRFSFPLPRCRAHARTSRRTGAPPICSR